MAHSESSDSSLDNATVDTTYQVRPTSLYFLLLVATTKEFFEEYLRFQLRCHKQIKYEVLRFEQIKECIEAEVQFPSINKAKRAQRALSIGDPNVIVSLHGFTSQILLSEIRGLCEIINRKNKSCIKQHRAKIQDAEAKHQALKQQKTQLADLQRALDEEKCIQMQQQELEYQLKEFERYCQNLLQQLQILENEDYTSRNVLQGRISDLQKELARECVRFQKCLPIYARRQEIIQSILSHQVIIVIGETGSGKSTQLVQYLFDAGFANDGCIIACTQPRKVAAVTLADHVSTEMCCSRGTIVAHRVSTSSKIKKETKIVYLTDHSLLNECIKDQQFSRYSCLVIDEAHERSLHTDILLAFIKRCLPLRPDLKVIITSATIDPQLFVSYFGSCPIVKVSGRTFPVDVVCNPLKIDYSELSLSSHNYVNDAVDVVKRIHTEEPAGDILVFLTSPAEIERACQLVQESLDSAIVVLPLHGKLQPQDQQKVFEIYQAKRKIVFSTNVAETSVTIPGIKYIVDSGVAKELCFDPKRNMNSLEVRTISKSSAEQRKGRAGRISAGKCYRLYTQEIYDEMLDRGLPEILRVHLTHAVLKLFEFGIDNILQFDFVEKPDALALKSAVDTLTFLGAIDGHKLTEVGKKLALLPVDPQLGKVLLDAIDEGVGIEAAITVSVSSLGGNVFFRGGTEDMKAESDRKKIQFTHPQGDQMTCLNVYKEWISEKKEARNQWCVENYINAKSMRLVEETLKELCTILENNLSTHLTRRVPNVELAEAKIPKLFFSAFLSNIGVFLGHVRAGYMTPRIAGEPLVIFPGSALVQCNQTPKYLAYEKTLKTSQHYLLQVLNVEEEWVEEAISESKLKRDQLQLVESYMVTPMTIRNIGPTLIRKLINKNIKQLAQDVSSVCQGSPIAIEPYIEKGKITAFVPQSYHERLNIMLEGRLNVIRQEMKEECYEAGVTKPEDDVKVVLGSGGCIQQVLMPYHFRTVIVRGPLDETWVEDAVTTLTRFGELQIEKKVFANEIRMYVTYKNPTDAANAAKIDGTELPENVSIEIRLVSQESKFFRLQIDWTRRERRDFAFINFNDEVDRNIAYARLRGQVSVGGSYVKFGEARNSKPGSCQLFVAKVSQSITEDQLKHVVETVLLDGNVEVKFGLQKPFTTTREQIYALNQQLQRLVSQYATPNHYKVSVLQPEDHHITFRAFVDFNNPDEGQRAMNGLVQEELSGRHLNVKPVLSSSVRFIPRVYEVIKEDVNAVKSKLLEQYRSNLLRVNEKKDKHGNILIEIFSSDLQAFTTAKSALNTVLQPHVIECRLPFLQQYVLSHQCRQDLDRIQSSTTTLIFQNLRTMTLSVYGTEANRTQALIQLNARIDELESTGVVIHELKLKGPDMPPGLMKHLVSLFGVDLMGILQMEGVNGASLDPRKQILTLFSTATAKASVMNMIDEYTALVPAHNTTSQIDDVEECYVCFTDIDNIKDSFRLECCGHVCHLDCIKLQIASNTVTFPLVCAADGCSHPFVWKDFQNLFKCTTLTLQSLIESSLKTYLPANKDKVRNCPTPDCKMVYVTSDNGHCFICGECKIRLCTHCHVQYHDGLTCAMYKSGKEIDKELEEWLQKNPQNRKRCPKCTAPIEKDGGCNHMRCSQCRIHICWICLQYFDNDQTCYRHLHQAHMSFF